MPSRPLVVTYENYLIWSARAADSNRHHARLVQPSHPQLKLSSVLRLQLIISRRHSKRVELVLSCAWFSSEPRVVLKMLMQPPGDLLRFAVELGFFLRDHPTPFTTTVATGPATVEYKQHRISTAHVAAAPR